MSLLNEIQSELDSNALRLMSEYRTQLYLEAMKLCGNPTDAEDLVIHTIDTALRNYDGCKLKENMLPWLRAILTNKFHSDNRRAVNRGTKPVDPSDLAADESLAANGTVEEILRNSDNEALRAALNGLDANYKQTVVMHYLMELPVKEIAKVLKVPVGTVLWRLNAARKMLARDLGEKLGKVSKHLLLILVSLAAGLTAAWAVNRCARVWTGARSGDLTDERNWAGTDEVRTFKSLGGHQDGLYIPTNHVFGEEVRIGEDGTRVTFDLGRDHKLTFGGKWNFDANDSVVEFVSGKIDNTLEEMNLMSRNGDWRKKHSRNTFRLKGEGTEFSSTKNVIFSYNGDSNRFEVVDGARFRGAFRFGNRNPRYQTVFVGNGASLSNTVGLTVFNNLGSRTIVSNATLVIARQAHGRVGGCTLEARDGAYLKVGQFEIGGAGSQVLVDGPSTRLEHGGYGNSVAFIGYRAEAHENLFRVSNGATAVFDSALVVGVRGAVGNQAEFSDDAHVELLRGGLFVGGSPYGDRDERPALSNVVCVTRGAVVTVGGPSEAHRAISVGGFVNPLSCGNRLIVSAGGSVSNVSGAVSMVGTYSSGNVLEVVGGTFYSSGILKVGFRDSEEVGTDNAVRIGEDGLVDVAEFWLARGNRLVLDGRRARLVSGRRGRKTRFCPGAEVVFDLSDGPFSSVPIAVDHGYLLCAATLRFTGLEGLRATGAEVTLMESPNRVRITPEALAAASAGLPAWAKLELCDSQRKLKLKIERKDK